MQKNAARTTAAKGNDRRVIAFLFGLIASLIVSLYAIMPLRAEVFNLPTVKSQVLRDYKDVSHMETGELAEMMAVKNDLLIFDVREENEFKVSHIPGAIRISPSSWGWTFLREYGDKVKGKTVVFYCSVGVRSSIMAARVQDGLTERGALKVKNLNGGIFAWHNENRSLINRNGNTSFVHPYDKHWGSLLSHQDQTRMSPIK